MSTVPVYVGLDYHSRSVQVCVVDQAGLVLANRRCGNSVLVEAGHRLRRLDARWSAFSRTLEARGKPVSVIVAAIANRWVRWLYHQVKDAAGPTERGPTPAAS